MSRQLKNLKIYPVTDNGILIVNDQVDYTPEFGLNKIIARTPDHFASSTDTIHSHVKDAPGTILEVNSTNPLSVTSFGYEEFDIDGYDGLVVSDDGYKLARGVIASTSTSSRYIRDPGTLSLAGHYYFFGGFDIASDGYVAQIWHSFNGVNFGRIDDPPWTARAGTKIISDGDDVWMLGGYNGTGRIKEIWHADVNTDSGDLTWDVAAVASNVSLFNDYFNATMISGINDAYVGAGVVDLTTGAETSFSFGTDGYSSVMHYDHLRHTLWYSKNGYRKELIITDAGQHLDENVPVFGYVHHQSSASATWTIAHNLGTLNVAPVFYTDDKEMLDPVTCVWDSVNQMTATFSTAITGRALICIATPKTSNTTWTLDGYGWNTSAWFCVSSTGGIIEPVTATGTSTLTLTFNAAESGYIVAWNPYNGLNVIYGRRYLASINALINSNSVKMYQADSAPLFWIIDSTSNLLEPSDIDYSSGVAAVADFIQAPGTIYWASMDLRHDGYRDVQEPWSANYASLAYNIGDTGGACYLLTSDGVWQSGDAGIHWNRKHAEGLNIPTNRVSPGVCEASMIATIDLSEDVSRSLDSGDEFSAPYSGISQQVINWYGDLGIPVDTTYKLFIYKRPGDVVWESDYGHLPGTIRDNFTTHYVLPFPAAISAGNTQAVTIATSASYGRAVTANEFVGDYLYLITKVTGAIVDKKKIISHDACSAGSSFTMYVSELNTSPVAGTHVVQIIKARPEQINYYSAISRNSVLNYTMFHESDGTAFDLNTEQEYEWYADMVTSGGLPSVVNTVENKQRTDYLHGELNRQRVSNKIFFNDPYQLAPELLERLGKQLGIELDENVDLRTQRRLAAHYFQLVDAYGPCVDGINNLIDLMFGANSGISCSVSDPTAASTISGTILTIGISAYADFHWDYTAANNGTSYSIDEGKWTMDVAIDDIAAELRTLTHRSLVHLRGPTADGPYLITDHKYNGVTNSLSMFFDFPNITQLNYAEGSSVIAIYSEPKQRRVFKFIDTVRKIVPDWIQIRWS